MDEQVIIVRSHDDGEVFSVVRPADPLNPQFTVDEIQKRLPDSIVELFTVTSLADFIEYDDDHRS